MARLQWDQPLESTFEAGVDRGVLFLDKDKSVAWSGLKSVRSAHVSDAPTPIYFDGRKVLDLTYPKERSSTLVCYSYPKEFERFDGYASIHGGISFGEQPTDTFSLSYRTRIGDHHKIHLLLNQTANAESSDYLTFSDEISPVEFTWNLTGTPIDIKGLAPTSYIVFDSRLIDEALWTIVEEAFYGNDTKDPSLNAIFDLLQKIDDSQYKFIFIGDSNDTWTLIGPDSGIDVVDGTFTIDGIRFTAYSNGTYIMKDDLEV